MDRHKRAMYGITAVFILAQLAVILALVLKGRTDYARTVMLTTLLQLAFVFLEVKYKLFMSTYVRILVVVTLFLDAAFGYYFDLYVTSGVFDKFLHFFGAYTFSLFAYIFAAQLQGSSLKKPVKFILVACLGLSMGAFYEIFEFLSDSISRADPPSQPSLQDTDLDLTADLIGSILAGFHAAFRKFSDKYF